VWRLLLVLGLLSSFALMWSQPSISDAAEKVTQGSAIAAPFADNSRCALGSHWRRTTSKPRDYDSDQVVEWISSAGPTPLFAAPQFRCVSAQLFRDSFGDNPGRVIDTHLYDSDVLWCGPGVSVLLIWEVFGGEAPYTISAAGHEAVSPAKQLLIPCTDIRNLMPRGNRTGPLSLLVPIQLKDALGLRATVEFPINVVADAPSASFDGMAIWKGWYDASAIVAPSDWVVGSFGAEGLGGIGEERLGPFANVAIGRYRAVGSDMWSYFDLSVETKQSAPSFYYPVLMNSLDPMTDYQVQGTWVWALEGSYLLEWEHWFEAWQRWMPLNETRWSQSQTFQTAGPVCPIAEVAGNSITVLHPATGTLGRGCTSQHLWVLTWLTSPDWPGVIWAYGAPWLRPSSFNDSDESRSFIAHYAGLPAGSDYVLRFQEPLPHAFRRAPQQSLPVSTHFRPIHATAPGVDPSDVKIQVGADQIIVEWTNQEPFLYGYADLFLSGTTTRHLFWDWYQNDSRTVTVFANLGGQAKFSLYVSFRAREPLADGSGFPNMCIIREIVVPPGGPDAYLDRYLFASSTKQPPRVSPGDDTPEVSVDYPYRYHHAGLCQLAAYAYP